MGRNRLDFFIFKPHRFFRERTFKFDQIETKWFDEVKNCIDNPNCSYKSPEWSIAYDAHSMSCLKDWVLHCIAPLSLAWSNKHSLCNFSEYVRSILNSRELEYVQRLIWLLSCLKYIDKTSHLALKNDVFSHKSLTFCLISFVSDGKALWDEINSAGIAHLWIALISDWKGKRYLQDRWSVIFCPLARRMV